MKGQSSSRQVAIESVWVLVSQ